MPYLAMLDRLKAFFHGSIAKARGGSGRLEEDAPRLIICGYSFSMIISTRFCSTDYEAIAMHNALR